MIETTGMTVLLCCRPTEGPCTVRDYGKAIQHARDRAILSGRRQKLSRRAGSWGQLWLIVTLPEEVRPGTWTFDGRVYKIIDTHS